MLIVPLHQHNPFRQPPPQIFPTPHIIPRFADAFKSPQIELPIEGLDFGLFGKESGDDFGGEEVFVVDFEVGSGGFPASYIVQRMRQRGKREKLFVILKVMHH